MNSLATKARSVETILSRTERMDEQLYCAVKALLAETKTVQTPVGRGS